MQVCAMKFILNYSKMSIKNVSHNVKNCTLYRRIKMKQYEVMELSKLFCFFFCDANCFETHPYVCKYEREKNDSKNA